MKKRLLSLTLAAVMLLSLLPVTAFAAAAGSESTPSGNFCRPRDGATVAATAKSIEADTTFTADKAIDGDTTTKSSRWSSANNSEEQWLQIDLGALRPVSLVRLYWERTNVTAYTLQISEDGNEWQTVYTCSSRITQTTEDISFTPATVQYIKIDVTGHDDQGAAGYSNIALYEVEVYENEGSIPVDIQGVPGQLQLRVDKATNKVVLDTSGVTIPEGQATYSFAANLEQVVGADGTIYTPLVNTQVEFDVTVTRFDGVTATTDPAQPIKLTIPGQHTANKGNAKPKVIPELAEWYSSPDQKGKYYTLTDTSKIVAPDELEGVAQELQADINDLFGFEPLIATTGAAAGDIVLVLDAGKANEGFDDETYLMEVTDRVTITATHATGAYWGTRSVLQALKYSGNKTVAQGTARDYPEFRLRGFMMDVGRKPVSMDMLYTIVKNMAWYKLNDFHVHLSDNLIFMEDYCEEDNRSDYQSAYEAYSAFRMESDLQEEEGAKPLTAKDYAYTKEGCKQFIADSAALGINIVPEFDVPAHAKAITDAFPSLRLNKTGTFSGTTRPWIDHLDLTNKMGESLAKVKEIFGEYISGDDPVFTGDVVHLGADEYYDDYSAYAPFAKGIADYIQSKGKTVRMWGSLSTMGDSQSLFNKEAAKDIQMNIWSTGWANPQAMYNLGFQLINITDSPFYMVPSGAGTGDRRGYGDYLNLTDLYAKSPNQIGSTWFPASSSQILGASFAMWNDNIDTRASGLDEVDLFDRFFDALPVAAVRMWGEGAELDRTLDELQADAAVIGTAPNTDPYHDGAEAPSYSFDSNKGLTLHSASVADGVLTLAGGASYAETGLDRLGWGSTLNFRIKVTSITDEGVIFESDHAYGDYAVKALPVDGDSTKWKLGFSRELYDYEFATELPVGEWVTLAITSEQQSTKLSVNGGAAVAAVGKFVAKADSNTQFKGKTGVSNSSFEIPVARIGSMTNSFVGQIDYVEGGQPLISPELKVTISSEHIEIQNGIEQGKKENAIDNNFGTQWSSEDMKDQATLDANGGNQKAQWLMVDLGEKYIYPVAIDSIKLCYNMKVWPMVYRVETSANGKDGWTTLVSVSRDPYDGGVKNKGDQNIASEPAPDDKGSYGPATESGENYDFITKTTSPALAENAAVQRYVRIYIEKVNTAAPGHNTGLREIQIYAPEPELAPEPIEGAWNLALNQPTKASGHDGASTSDRAVDGNTSSDHQWSSANMKDAATLAANGGNQKPQWLWVDLGATGSRINEIKLYYNRMVWPMVYEIQTTDDAPDAQDAVWETVVRVERSPYSGAVKNGVGQNIADETNNNNLDTATNTDTITATSSPRLQMTTLKRYVRVYIEKVNTLAGGDNTGIRELVINGTNPNRHLPVDVNAVLNSATSSTVTADGSAVSLPDAPTGAVLAVAGSTLENVIANDGTIGGKNIGERQVTLLVRAWDDQSPDNYQQKNLTVTVPDHKGSYPAAWFPAVTNANAKPEVIPAIQEWYGYTGNFKLSDSSRIVINDAANVGLQKAADNMKADVLEISGLDLPIVTGTSGGANDIYIESLTADSYDLGKEGYLMRVSDEGIKIYAPTYTGCIFGTITVEQILWQAEDHLSVPKGIMRDYPAYEVRGVKLDVGRAPTRYQQLKDYAKIMLWYKMSEYDLHINDTENPNTSIAAEAGKLIGFHRLESSTFPSLKLMDGVKRAGVDPNLVDADYYNDSNGYGGNPVYTKQQWKDLAQLTKDYGMHLLTEIDMPGHALAYNQYVEKYPAEAATGPIRSTDTDISKDFRAIELLDLTGTNAENALNFAKALWDEYTSDGTITGDVVHIGADEYWLTEQKVPGVNDAFANFVDELREVIQTNLPGTKIRMWGAGASKFSTATTVLNKTHAQLAEDYELEIWDVGYDNPVARSRDGYKIVNCEQSAMYSCPGRHQRDVPNAEYLFNSWDPTMFGSNGSSRLLYGDPNLLGAKAVMWGEQTQEGLTERDVHQRVLRAIAITAEKTWSGTQQSEGTFSDYEMRAARLAEGPGTEIAMNVDSETSLVLDYDFKNISTDGTTVYDASGNGYNGALNAAGTVDADGFLTFDGSTLLTTELKTLSYPYTVSFDLKVGAGNTAESSLFSGYDGRIQVAGHSGHISANNGSFIRDFNYTAPTGTAVNITLVGTFQATRLYVNGELVTFLSQTGDTFQDGVVSGAITSYFSSVPLPLEKIGQNFKGQMANLKVYNKAMTAAEVAAVCGARTDDGLVNVAQNAVAGGSSFQTGDGYDGKGNANQRTAVAQKAVDGEEEEMYSFWRGDHADSALTVDLGQVRKISRVDLQWRAGGIGSGFKIQTSMDGKTWTDAKTITGNTSARQSIELQTAVDARFVRMQGVSGTYELQEMLVYENVSPKKTELASSLEKAEKMAEFRGLSFESTGDADQADFADLVFARAVMDNPLATIADVQRAIDGLEDQLFVSVTTIALNKTEATICTDADDVNHTVTLTPTIGPDTATNKVIRWTTSDPDVATVSEGVVTAVGVGEATITATAADGSGVSAACTVTVAAAVPSVNLTALQTAYNKAKDVTNEDYTDASWDAFETARNNAKEILDNKGAGRTQKQIDDAADALTTAQEGLTKNSGSESPSPSPGPSETPDNPVLPVTPVTPENPTPSNPGSGSSGSGSSGSDSSGTTTITTTNPDGSTTTTVTDGKTGTKTETTRKEDGTVETVETKRDGTVTEITEKPDGTVETVKTKKDGTVIETIEKPDGSSEVVETKPNGTVTEVTERPDGSSEVVETKPDGTVTATSTDPGGAKVEKVTTPEKDVAITVTNKQGEVLAKVELPAEIPEPETRFVDVPEGHWADKAIHNMAALEVVKGEGNNTFNRGGDMKRGDLALVLSRMSSAADKSYKATFADVPATKYYANGVAWAAKTGVVTGRSADTFAPEDTITREELAVMLYRYGKLLKLDAEVSKDALNGFKDGGDTHGWAKEGMAWCVKNGILQGKGNNILDPRTNVTRAEVAVMLQRFMDLMK